MSTVFVFAPGNEHTKQGHPEANYRLAHLLPFLEQYQLLSALQQLPARTALLSDLQRVHNRALVDQIRHLSERGGGLLDHGDTYVTAVSYEAARTAAGAGLTAVDAILSNQARNGFAIVRPPGHHAESSQVSGFCLFNNIAIAARYAQATYNCQRILIVDFDIHHGNGTQEIFFQDDTVLFISAHLFIPRLFYPGSGGISEIGIGHGRGYTLNMPLPPLVGDVGYGRLWQEVVWPRATTFAPDLILVSAGYDAHWQDPLSMSGLSLAGYAHLSRQLVQLADALCHGRILFMLEGGYHEQALAYGILNTFYALLGHDQQQDPLGPMSEPETDVTDLLHTLKARHLIY